MPNYLSIERSMILWAIERSGKQLRDFDERVETWLSSDKKPTFRQLQKFAKSAMVPFGYLFLSNPPSEDLPVPDFRTRGDGSIPRPSPNLTETIFEMERRQNWMRNYLVDLGNSKLQFVGKYGIKNSAKDVADDIRRELKLGATWAKDLKDTPSAIRSIRKRIENAGILIFLNGVVGNSTNRPLDANEFQGFVLIDDYSPLIFVNGTDAKTAQLFTIGHELAHVWIGKGAIFNDIADGINSESDVEKFCNNVAAELLMDKDSFLATWSSTPDGKRQAALSRLFKVSPIAIARRAMDLKLISREKFFSIYRLYKKQLKGLVVAPSDGGNFWTTQNTRLGGVFGKAVVSAAREGRISYTDAFSLTRLTRSSFNQYSERVRNGSDQ